MRELITRRRKTNFCVNCSSELLTTDNFGSSDIEMGTRTGQSSLYESLSLVFNLKLLENVSPSSSLDLDLDLEVDTHPIIEENSHYSENEGQLGHCDPEPDPGAIINNTFKLDLNPMLCLNCSMVFDVLYQLFVEFSNLRTTGSYLTRKIKQVEDLFVVLLAQSSLASASASASGSVAVTEAEGVKTGGGTPATTTTTMTTSASIMESSGSIMSTPTSDPTPMEVILLESEPLKIISSENENTDEIMISNLNFQELTMSTSDPVAQIPIPIPIPIDICSVLEPVQPVQPTSIIAFDLAHMEDSSVRGILSDDETSSIQLDLDMFGGSDSGISAVDDLSVSDDIFKEIYFETPGNNNNNTSSINFHSTSSSTSSSLSSEDSYTNALNEVLIPPLQLQHSALLQTQQNQNQSQQNDNCVHYDELEVDNFEHFSFATSSTCLNENDLTEAQQNNISIKIKTDNNKDNEDNDVDAAMKQFFIPPLSISPGIGTSSGISEAASPSPSSTSSSSTTSIISSTSSYLGKLLPFQAVQEAYPTDNELEEFKQSSLQPPFLCPKSKCNKKRFLHVTNYLRHVRTHLHMFRFKCPSVSTCPHPYKNYKSLKEHCEKYHDCTPLPPSSNSSASSASTKTFISRRGPRPPFKYQLFPTKTSPGTIKAILTTFTQAGLQGAEGDWTSIFDSNNSQTQIEIKGEVDTNLITSPELELSTKYENESPTPTTATTTTTILTIINCDLERSIHLRNGSLNTVLPFPQCEPFNCPCPSSTPSCPDPSFSDHEGSQDRTNQICPETYKTSKELTAHIRATHGKFEYLYKCPQCPKLYPKKTQIFNNHLPVCGKAKDKSKYKIYLPPYICQVCNQEFPKREKLLKHCRRFHSDKQFKCDTCLRSFKLKQDLNRHASTHTDERGHICGDCGKSYKTLGNLKFHFKISHTEEGRLQYNQYSRLKNQRIKLAKRSAENEKLTSN